VGSTVEHITNTLPFGNPPPGAVLAVQHAFRLLSVTTTLTSTSRPAATAAGERSHAAFR